MHAMASNPTTRPRRAKPARPRLGNTWQELGWRMKLATPLPREPLAKLAARKGEPAVQTARRA